MRGRPILQAALALGLSVAMAGPGLRAEPAQTGPRHAARDDRAPQAGEIAFARAYLSQLQVRSFRSGREYCGFFGYDETGRMVAVKPRPGGAASCTAIWPHRRIRVFASYHTHGVWDGYSDGEVPSVEDLEGDMEDGIHGYISTPGGRFWLLDGPLGTARQVCGAGCLPTDPDFVPEPEGSVPVTLTLDELRVRQGD